MANISLLVIIEAEIATTHLIERMLTACEPYGIAHKVQFLDKLTHADFTPNVMPLFIRCGDPMAFSWAQTLVDARYPYLFYIDDNFWRIVGNSPLAEYYRHPAIRLSLEFMVSNARMVITNSRQLADFLTQFNERTAILPTFFDFSLIEEVRQTGDEAIRIGFAGSPSRADDLELISPLINPILEKFPKVVFEFAGVMPKGIEPRDRILFFPHTHDYKGYIRFQAARKWAIGLAPLIDHEANRSKTDNKYREYGACGCAGIYSDIPPYNDVVENSVTGLLVSNNGSAWLDALTDLIANPDKRVAISEAALGDVRSRYDITHVAKTWADFFADLSSKMPRKAIKFDKPIPWRRRALQRIERIRLGIAILHREGGWSLVVQRIARKLFRLATGAS